jgi:excisionase family DNA binding protein
VGGGKSAGRWICEASLRADDGSMPTEFAGRLHVVVVIDSHDRNRTPPPGATRERRDGAVIELTVTLTDEQIAEIAERAAAFVPTSAQAATPWLNVAEAAERLRCSRDRIYDLIALGKLHPRRDGRRVLLHRDDLDAYIEGRAS